MPIRYEDDVWDLGYRATTAGAPSDQKISFREFRPTIAEMVKGFLAEGILGAGFSNSWAQGTLVALRQLIRLLDERRGDDYSPLHLETEDARAVEDHFRGFKQGRHKVATIRDFATYLRQRHNGRPADFRPDPRGVPPRRGKDRSYSEGLERLIPDEVSEALMEAIGLEEIAIQRRAAQGNDGRVRSVPFYLACLKLMVFTGRRISEILLLLRECLREPTADELAQTGPGVWLRYHNTKVQRGFVEVFAAEPAAQLVRDAVGRVRELTAPLAEQSGLDRLFLTDSLGGGNGGGQIRTVSANALRLWLNGHMADDGAVERAGFVHRHNITYQGVYYQIDPHQTRHTQVHKAYLGGASYVDVGEHVHHRFTREGFSPMTGVYIHGRETDVQHIKEMHERRLVVGKTVPLLDNRAVKLDSVNRRDLAVIQAQGLFVQPTKYGECILPLHNGPCVCGDPCWIGPEGDGCDYALYTPESKTALVEDGTVLDTQIDALRGDNPRHPRLGNFVARRAQLDRVLGEIAAAEGRSAAGLVPERPRAGIVPAEPDLPPDQPNIPAERTMRQRRREAALRSGTQFPVREKAVERSATDVLTETERANAEVLLAELAARNRAMEPATFARRLGIDVVILLNTPDVLAQLAAHNRRPTLTAESAMEARLTELDETDQPASYDEFAALCGLQWRAFFANYPAWCKRINAHNKVVGERELRTRAEGRLVELASAQTVENAKSFAKALGVCPNRLRREFAEIVQRLVEQNRTVDVEVRDQEAKDLRSRIADTWEEARAVGEDPNVDELAERCGISRTTIYSACPMILPWLRDSKSGLPMRQDAARAHIVEILDAARRAGEDLSLAELAERAGVSQATLRNYCPELPSQLRGTLRPATETSARIRAAWQEARAAGKDPDIGELAEIAGVSRRIIYDNCTDIIPQLRGSLKGRLKEAEIRGQIRERWEEARRAGADPDVYELAALGGVPVRRLYKLVPEVIPQLRTSRQRSG